jgi:L-alanine-DL-glutamate epimerase-like enolase superfamily enzyme
MKITALETIHLPDYPSILFVAVHTDAGLTGHADTCYAPDAVAGYIHKFAAPMLLGHDPLAIELHWRRLYEVIAHTVGKGAELRGLSAIDVCLWDILGQAAGMPVWQVLGGQDISAADIHRALEPFRKIRKAVGDRMDLMLEGHGLWSLPAAVKIARAVEEFRPAWLEDLMRADDVEALAELRRSSTMPILASEYLATRYEYKPLLEARAADIVMIDPTWAGGITESKKVCAMAEAYKRPVAMHDCTGPLTLYAGIHLAINATNAVYQESVRAYLRVNYPELVTELPTIEQGQILAPTKPGLGTTLLPDVRTRAGATVVVTRA